MAVVQMKRMNLVALKQNRKSILERLQELGVLEINIKDEELPGTSYQDTSTARATFQKRAQSADQAIEILKKYAPEKTSLFASLEGKPLVSRQDYDATVQEQTETMQKANRIIALEKEITEANANILKLQNQSEALVPWKNLDVPMNLEGTRRTTLFIGTIPNQIAADQILAALKGHDPAVENADVEIISADKDATYLSVLCLKEDALNAEEALREIGFAKPSWSTHNTPAQEQELIAKQSAGYQADIEKYIAEIKELSPCRNQLRMVSDYYGMRADKYEVLGTLPQTQNTFVISGYIPVSQADAVKKEMEESYGAAVEIEELDQKEDPPVLLKNNAFSNCVEGVLASYGLPQKGEIDPTFIMSIFYVVFFGMMLSDAGYGILITVACGVMLLKFPRMSEGLHKSIKMFFFCGISTIFWGCMYGSFFGDLISVVSSNWFGHEVTFKALWFTPLDDPMKLLVYCLLFGLIHMFVGMGIKGYMLLKKHDIVGFVSDILSWYLFLIGLILILLPTSLFESISNMTFNFPDFVQPLAIAMAVVGAVIILLMAGRRKGKHIGMRLALGLYGLYDITSWLSDILSYSRLLALGLATGVIAQVVNQMGTMFGTGILGTILFIVIFIIGSALNLAINMLGAYVHSNRLEYVEFFGKFYDGGGRPFAPFKAVTKYVEFAKSK